MKKLKFIFWFLAFTFCCILIHLILTIKFYSTIYENVDNQNINKDVCAQLNFLEKRMHHGGADEMQNFFPEGRLFSLSLYGLTWCDFIKQIPKSHPIYKKGIQEIDYSIQEILLDKSKIQFDNQIDGVRYGAFYTGWASYLKGRKIQLVGLENCSEKEIHLFKSFCKEIGTALENKNFAYLESYPNQIWPADNILCLASLHIYNKLFDSELQNAENAFIKAIESNLDQYGLIPHRMKSDGKTIDDNAHGNSMSLMLILLKEISPQFSQNQFLKYKKLFLDTRFGLYGLREYPKGINLEGDIDSGPVILDIGGAASIVGIRTLKTFGSVKESEEIRNSVEAFGLGNLSGNQKNYLLGQMLMADLFIAWANVID